MIYQNSSQVAPVTSISFGTYLNKFEAFLNESLLSKVKFKRVGDSGRVRKLLHLTK